MDLMLQYLFCGVVVMFFFEMFRRNFLPDSKTTYIDGIFGIIIFPLILLAFVVGFIYYYINLKNK
tara:strand:+ start:268 stop:462 length:195 start_codon:yes stop_codon:yes gene_type:complete